MEVIKLNEDYSKFYFEPTLPKIQFENGKLKFESQVENEFCNKDAIFYTNSHSNKKNIDTSVIMIHGWRSEKLNRLEEVFLDDFKKLEYATYSYILPFHMDRCPNGCYSGEYFYSANINRTLKSFMQAVNDIRALIKYFKKCGNRVIIIGLSLGALIANLISEHEKDIDLLISIFAANNLVFTTFETEAGKFIKKDFLEHRFDANKLNECWKIINPTLKKPLIDLNKILLIYGCYDKYVLNEDTKLLAESWGKQRDILQCGHSGIVINKKEIKNKVLEFINKDIAR